jgi:hypothetical protein
MITKIRKYYPGLGESWWLLVLVVLAGGILSGILAIIAGLIFPANAQIFPVIFYPIMYLPALFHILFRNRQGVCIFEEKPLHSPDYGRAGALVSFLLIFLMVPAFNIITEPLYSWMGMPDFMVKLLEQISDNGVAGFITISIFAPFFEEIFCRGIILRGLLKTMSPAKAILWSAFMFGVMHMNPWQAVPAILVGILMGWLYYKTGSLLLTMFVHFVNNTTSFVVMKAFPDLPFDSTIRDIIPGKYYILIYLLALIYAVLTIFILNKYYGKSISDKVQPDN